MKRVNGGVISFYRRAEERTANPALLPSRLVLWHVYCNCTSVIAAAEIVVLAVATDVCACSTDNIFDY